MITQFLFIAVISVLPTVDVFANLPEEPSEYAAWEARLLAAVSAQNGAPPAQAIPKLGAWVAQLSQEGSPNWEQGDRPVFHAAQRALLAIPGHAEFYRDRILTSRVRAQSDLNDMNRFGPSFTKFMNERSNGFVTLRNLPSVETVRVLGEFLSDEWVSPIPVQDSMMDSPMSVWAVRSLSRLPFAPKPVATKFDHEAERDLPAWQSWYDQIKSDQRTFRFEGDPTEYDLNGPAPKEKLARIERDRKRDEERATGLHKSPAGQQTGTALSPTSRLPAIAGVVAAFALCAGAVWYFLRNRRLA